MANKTSRGHVNTDEVLKKLAVGRDGAIQVCREAKISSPEYGAAGEVMEAINKLAERLTGDGEHFHLKVAPATSGPPGWKATK